MPEDPDEEPAADQRRGIAATIRELPTPELPAWVTKKRAIIAGVAVVALAVTAGVLPAVVGGDDQTPEWVSQTDSVTQADEAINEAYPQQMWTLTPEEATSASWYAAGIIGTTEDEITLYSTGTGSETATVDVEDYDLEEDLAWTAEFYDGETPAVGLRLATEFIALTADGDTQRWDIPEDAEIQIYGTTPLLSQEDDGDTTYQALVIGEDDPVELTPNRELGLRAVDQTEMIQVDGSSPRVALNPIDRESGDSGHAITLTPPTGDAEFIRHLDAGHSLSLALWQVDDDLYIGVHPLSTEDDTAEAETFVQAPFGSSEDATSWTIGRGMQLAVIGPYAIDMTTGELAAESHAGDFTNALGEAAVVAPEDGARSLTIDQTIYDETDRVVGHTGRGSLVTYSIDGSIVVHGQAEGAA